MLQGINRKNKQARDRRETVKEGESQGEELSSIVGKKVKKKKQHFSSYLRVVPQLLEYKLIAFVLLQVVVFGLKKLGMLLIYSTGRVAVTSGDYRFLFRTWQGWLIMLITFLAFFFAMSVDINGTFLLSARLLRKEKVQMLSLIRETFASIPKFINKHGILLCLYVALGAPFLGVGFNLTLTKHYYIPSFVVDAIRTSPRYMCIYVAIMAFLVFFGVRNTLAFPYILVDGKTAHEATILSHRMIRKKWRPIASRLLIFTLQLVALLLLLSFLIALLGTLVTSITGLPRYLNRFIFIFTYGGGVLLLIFFVLSFPAMEALEITRIFMNFDAKEEIFFEKELPKRSFLPLRVWSCCLIASMLFLSFLGTLFFDELFPARTDTKIVAHRLGGYAAPENSLLGFDSALNQSAYGFETDIQRSKDGVYVINHDNTFARTCGVNRLVSDMTWEEIQQLRIADPTGKPSGQHPPSLEELLDYARGKGKLYLELKGPTADLKMADDVSRMVQERGMMDQCVITSLKYSLVAHVYHKYPKIETGYIYYFSFGDRAALDCDDMIMEEEAATESAINTVHNAGKKVLVWTVNSPESAYRFMDSDADAVITDQVSMCKDVEKGLEARSDTERVIDYLSRNPLFGVNISQPIKLGGILQAR